MGQTPEILGSCDPRFAPVGEALRENFGSRGELGAAVVVEVEGTPVVDVWAGWMDEARTRAWERDTLVAVFSVGKAMATLCVLILVERGEIGLDVPVCRYWPEFAESGKDSVTVRTVLSHRAGLPAVRRELPDDAIYDWDIMASALAREQPWWPPGTTHGYHVNTFGFLAGELVRRASGEAIGAFFRREVASRLDADFHFGTAPRDDARTAEYVFGGEASSGDGTEQRPSDALDDERKLLLTRVYMNPPGVSGIGTVNTRAWRAAQIPSANAHATARGLARVYSALANGGAIEGIHMLAPETIEVATSEHSYGDDFVLGRPSRFGLGFQLTQPERQLGPNGRSFGHFGVGGSVGFADPDEHLAFAYTMNRSGPRWQNPRNRALIDAVYASL